MRIILLNLLQFDNELNDIVKKKNGLFYGVRTKFNKIFGHIVILNG